MQYNKAIVGRNAFAHESGIHQDGMLKNAQTYEIMTPESVGVKQTSLVMGKHSGRHAFVHKLEELGYQLASNQLEDAFVRFKALADRKKQIYDEDIEALVDEEIAHAHDRIKVLSLTVIAGTMGPQSATLTLDIDGEHVTTQSTGNGPVDAIFNAIRALVPHEAKLELYQVHAVTEGTDAQAEVSVRLSESGRSFTAKGADPDTLVASAKAYLGALNKLISKRNKVPGSRTADSFDRRRLKLCIKMECRAPKGRGDYLLNNGIWFHLETMKSQFCPHFVRFRGKIGGYVATHNPLTLLGTHRNEKASMRGRIRARDDRLVARWWLAGARHGNRWVQWDAPASINIVAYQERAQIDPGAGAVLGASRGCVARSCAAGKTPHPSRPVFMRRISSRVVSVVLNSSAVQRLAVAATSFDRRARRRADACSPTVSLRKWAWDRLSQRCDKSSRRRFAAVFAALMLDVRNALTLARVKYWQSVWPVLTTGLLAGNPVWCHPNRQKNTAKAGFDRQLEETSMRKWLLAAAAAAIFVAPGRRNGAGADRHQIQPRRRAEHAEGQGRRKIQGARREIHQRQGQG